MELIGTRRRLLEALVRRINHKNWWHVQQDPDMYKMQGTFLTSTFRKAEGWGQPLKEPYQVSVSSPFVGDEEAIEIDLLRQRVPSGANNMPPQLKWNGGLKKAALNQGYDCVVFMSPKDFEDYRLRGKIPLSIDLTIFL
jgi:hypothetical protein